MSLVISCTVSLVIITLVVVLSVFVVFNFYASLSRKGRGLDGLMEHKARVQLGKLNNNHNNNHNNNKCVLSELLGHDCCEFLSVCRCCFENGRFPMME